MKGRNIGREILDGIRAIKKGEGKRYNITMPTDVKRIREDLHLSQSAFATIMGVSVRTLQDWEQGRRKPSGPASALLRIANTYPDVFKKGA